MPHDLFGDVVHPTAGLGSRKWYTLPLSLLLHAFILTAVIVVPLMAAGVLPTPARGMFEWVQAVPVTPPDVPLAPRTTTAAPQTMLTTNPDAAPVDAPSGVRDEAGVVEPEPRGGGVEGGLPDGVEGTISHGLPELPPPPPPVAPIRVHAGVRPPTKIRNVSPAYPQIAQAAKVQGVVILEAIIGTDGKVRDARVLRSIPLLDQAALDAVRQWVFTPTLLNGVPVAVVMTVTVAFTLK